MIIALNNAMYLSIHPDDAGDIVWFVANAIAIAKGYSGWVEYWQVRITELAASEIREEISEPNLIGVTFRLDNKETKQ